MWSGSLRHYDGMVALKLEVETRRSAFVWVEDSRRALEGMRVEGGRLRGSIPVTLRTQESFHGSSTLLFELSCSDEQLTGVAYADAGSYFRLPHYVKLKRERSESPSWND